MRDWKRDCRTTKAYKNRQNLIPFYWGPLIDRRGALYWPMCLCLSPQAYLRNYTPRIQPFFVHVSYGRQAVVRESLRYVMYFRFYGSRRICTYSAVWTEKCQERYCCGEQWRSNGLCRLCNAQGPGGKSGLQWNQFFCFPIQNVVKSTEIYGFLHVFTQQLC